jgi:hypothetical protein
MLSTKDIISDIHEIANAVHQGTASRYWTSQWDVESWGNIRQVDVGIYANASNFSSILKAIYGEFFVRDWKEQDPEADVNSYLEVDAYPDDIEWDKWMKLSDAEQEDWNIRHPAAYVVADTLDQCKAFWKPYIDAPDQEYMISYFTVKKSPECDWRWHKWGRYIGTHAVECEYLRDEKDIEQVICAHIYKITEIPL